MQIGSDERIVYCHVGSSRSVVSVKDPNDLSTDGTYTQIYRPIAIVRNGKILFGDMEQLTEVVPDSIVSNYWRFHVYELDSNGRPCVSIAPHVSDYEVDINSAWVCAHGITYAVCQLEYVRIKHRTKLSRPAAPRVGLVWHDPNGEFYSIVNSDKDHYLMISTDPVRNGTYTPDILSQMTGYPATKTPFLQWVKCVA